MLFQFLTEPPLVLGTVALTGLVLQGKRPREVLEGTARTVLGFALVLAGVHVLLPALLPLTGMLRKATGVRGVMPDVWAPVGVLLQNRAAEISLGTVLAFLSHLLLARIVSARGRRYLFLTSHNLVHMTAWFVTIFPGILAVQGSALGVAAGLAAGLYCTVLPMLADPFTRRITGGEYTLGNIQTFNMMLASTVGKYFGTPPSADDAPGHDGARSKYDLGVLLSMVMPPIYLLAGLAAGPAVVRDFSGQQHWLIWLTMNGLRFATAIAIIMVGTQTFSTAMLPAFEGIARRLLPRAIPALDSVMFFPLRPTGAILGFAGHFCTALGVFAFLVLLRAPLVIIPGPSQAFFEGALAGVFGDLRGGWRGAVLAGVVSGLLTHLGAIPLYWLQDPLQATGVAFSVSDLVVLTPLFYVLRWVTHLGWWG